MTLLALIPARSGSTRLPGKNLRMLAGKPMLAWTVEAAVEAARFAAVYVSTDDEEIATCARAHGADVIMRPSALATDESPIELTIEHASSLWDRWHSGWKGAMLLNPTSPCRTTETIRYACSQLDYDPRVVGVREAGAAHFRGKVTESGWWAADYEERVRTQDAKRFVENGALYGWLSVCRGTPLPPHQPCRAVVMSAQESVDVDTVHDHDVASVVMRKRLEGKVVV